tara:strand:- start:10 stop:231 length:222 start_codon:yes stop_codon:yes gene_type:complete
MDKTSFWEKYRKLKNDELVLWVEELNLTDRNKIINRVSQLDMEISHGRYYDGWTLKGMKLEREKLNSLLRKNI